MWYGIKTLLSMDHTDWIEASVADFKASDTFYRTKDFDKFQGQKKTLKFDELIFSVQGESSYTCQEIHQCCFPSTIRTHNSDSATHVNTNIQILQAKIISPRILEANVVQLH